MIEDKTLKAGAIILSSVDKNKIAILYSSKQNDYSFPKGHVESGENVMQTMLREVKEETGLDIKIIQTLPDINYITPSGEAVLIKMFLVESEDDSKLKPEFDKDNVEWVPINAVAEKLSYNNLKEYFNSVKHFLNK